MLRTLGYFAVIFAVPAFSYALVLWFGENISGSFVNGKCLSSGDWIGECALLNRLPSLERLTFYGFVVAAVPVVLFFVAGVICGASRRMNVLIFPLLVPVALFFAAVNLLVQGGLLLADLYTLFAFTVGFWSYMFLRIAAAALVLGVFLTIMSTFFTEVESPLAVRGTLLGPRRGRQLLAAVARLCDRLEVAPPSQIIVGLEPSTWASASPVELYGMGKTVRLEGMTLHISLSQLRILGDEAVLALIASELALFRRRDRDFSQRFLPLWTSLSGRTRRRLRDIPDPSASGRIQGSFSVVNGLLWIASYPVRAMLGMLAICFSANRRRIGRGRTARADRAAAEIAGAEVVGSALTGAAICAPLWDDLIEMHIDRAVSPGRLTQNLVGAFTDLVMIGQGDTRAGPLARTRLRHPIDRAPVLDWRLGKLGLSVRRIVSEEVARLRTTGDDSQLLSAQHDLEFELTEAENRWLDQMRELPEGLALLPEDPADPLQLAVLGVVATLVANGRVPRRRFDAASAIGVRRIEGFDPLELAAAVSGRLPVPDLADAATRLQRYSPEAERAGLLEVFRQTLRADGTPEPSEAELMSHLETLLRSAPEMSVALAPAARSV